MSGPRRSTAARCLLPIAVGLGLAACSGTGDLSVVNNSGEIVTVDLGDEQSEVSPDGGVVFLGYGCTPGDVTIERASGPITVTGPICPDQEIVVDDDGAHLVPAG